MGGVAIQGIKELVAILATVGIKGIQVIQVILLILDSQDIVVPGLVGIADLALVVIVV